LSARASHTITLSLHFESQNYVNTPATPSNE
jgi:hypothetical protein